MKGQKQVKVTQQNTVVVQMTLTPREGEETELTVTDNGVLWHTGGINGFVGGVTGFLTVSQLAEIASGNARVISRKDLFPPRVNVP